MSGARTYIATCPVADDEIRERVARHRREREGRRWKTLEAPLDLVGALDAANGGVVLIDCITLWVSNLMYDAEQRNVFFGEEQVAGRATDLIDAARRCDGDLFAVTGEVGMGIVPAHPVARRFRDLAGRCNQILAEGADEVVLMVSGIPVSIKSDRNAVGDHDVAS